MGRDGGYCIGGGNGGGVMVEGGCGCSGRSGGEMAVME